LRKGGKAPPMVWWGKNTRKDDEEDEVSCTALEIAK
jgi:hypothetical protein